MALLKTLPGSATNAAAQSISLPLWKKFFRIDWWLVALALVLCVISVLTVYSATYTSEIAQFRNAARSQCLWAMLGLTGMFIMALIDYRLWIRYALPLFGAILVVLIMVAVVGHRTYGAKSWIRFGSLSVEPAEFCKVLYILVLAWIFQTFSGRGFKMFCAVFAFMLVPVVLILKQPDLGSAAVLIPITFAMMFVAGVKKRYLILPILGGVALCLYIFAAAHPSDPTQEPKIAGLKPYQVNRILSFFNSDRDPLGAAWTINQSLIATGSGGLHGKGYLQGTQNVLGFLPKTIAYNDFIFPVLCEEWGFIGGTTLIVLEGLLLLLILRIAARTVDSSGTLIAVGVIFMMFTHMFVNIGMTIKVVPITGIPLPFISYGGTFLVVCFGAVGLVQSIWIHRKNG